MTKMLQHLQVTRYSVTFHDVTWSEESQQPNSRGTYRSLGIKLVCGWTYECGEPKMLGVPRHLPRPHIHLVCSGPYNHAILDLQLFGPLS